MKHIVIIGAIVFVLSLFSGAYAQQDINFICKNECLEKSGTLGKCNALCSTTNESGNKTKDTNCLSSCMSKSNETAYTCYSACDIGSGGGKEEPAPVQGSEGGDKPQS